MGVIDRMRDMVEVVWNHDVTYILATVAFAVYAIDYVLLSKIRDKFDFF